MRIAIQTDDAALGRALAAEVEDSDFDFARDLKDAHIAIVDGRGANLARKVQGAHAVNASLDVMLLVDESQVRDVPHDVADFIVQPAPTGYVAKRLALVANRSGHEDVDRNKLMALAIEAAGDVVEIADPNAVLSYVNPAFTQTLGYGADEAIGKTPGELMRSNVHSAEYFQTIARTLRDGQVWKGELVSRHRDGHLVHFDATVTPVRAASGRITHHFAVKRDVTERLAAEARLKATNEALEQARDAALEASRTKSQFLANMSHELRTPLNAIIGYSEMLIEDAGDVDAGELQSDLAKILSAGKHLLGLINDILDLSKIEAGRFELAIEEVDLRELLEASVATIRPLASDRKNKVTLSYGLDRKRVRADPTRLKQVVFNLLSNANKFTEAGEIAIEARLGDDASEYVVSVRDTGIGMSEEDVAKLFRPFTQADATITRKYGGTGLGLTISKSLCQMMGGDIEVQSQSRVGSVFSLRLPLDGKQRPEAAAARRLDPPRRGNRVLIIDDDRSVHELIGRPLARAGFAVESATGSREGLAAAIESRPDLVVLDVVMPEMDGWDVLTELKHNPVTHDIPVVMLTFLESRETGMALGATEYLVKPVDPCRLVDVVRRYCRQGVAHVLVVDDDGPTRELMRRVLVDSGHEVTEAEDGRAGLAALAERRPDIVLLDLMMPEVDGFTFLERMRADSTLADLPVVVVTAKLLTQEDRRQLEGSTQAIIKKGDLSGRELLQTVVARINQCLQPGH